jgi:hypothetical protein
MVRVSLEKGGNSAGLTEILHIYAGLTSALPARTYTAVDFSVPDAPVITVTPANEQLTVTWAAVDGADSYEVFYRQLTDDVSGAAKLTEEPTGTTAAITGLTNGQTYYVWVRAKNNAGSSGYSASVSGIPVAATAAPAVPAAPTVTQIGDQLQLAVSWTPVAGATSYKVIYHTSNSSTASAVKDIDTITGVTGTITGAQGALTRRVYYVFVKAINDQGESAYSTAGIGIFPPAAPVVGTPAANQLSVTWTTLTAGGNAYEVYYNTAKTTNGATRWTSDPTSGSVTLTGLDAGTTYYVWVKARSNIGPTTSAFSLAGSGTVVLWPIPDPDMAPTATPGVRQLALSWTAITGSTSYEVWYGTSNDSDGAVKFGDTPLTTAVITKLADATSYYVWIKAKNIAGTTGFSPRASGTTQTPSGIGIDRGTVTVKDSGGAAVTSITLFKSASGATPQTITLSVDGTFTNGQWYVDGVSKGGSPTLILDADVYTATVHSVSFAGWRDGAYVSSTPIPFTVYGF